MKLHYTKILLFSIPLNILAHNKNKPYITPHHTPIYASRVLSEGDIQSSIYDKDAEMKSVKENFDRQTSQRLREYDERMKDKRQKRKEQRDKNIQEIIEKNKMEKSLSEKIEKCCLRCGCGLGGVAAGIGLFGGFGIYGWKIAATAAAIEGAQEAVKDAAMAASFKAVGDAAGIKTVIEGLKELYVLTLDGKELGTYITATNYHNASLISSVIIKQYNPSQCMFHSSGIRQPFCSWVMEKSAAAKKLPQMFQKGYVSHTELVQTHVSEIVAKATTHASDVTKTATDEVIQSSTLLVEAKYATCQIAIIASVVALLIIVLIMIIIYLVLRYRRKKKMNKKAQYTKLLNQ
ncbi:rifin [Plasmodium reichenowi]|uniref:Rifin n=1 Tax=Plasmodium reichenowi TaxID=5854 RepID=A0A060RQK1_PLARE|nr:rifin [Plasmodium reichenowi]